MPAAREPYDLSRQAVIRGWLGITLTLLSFVIFVGVELSLLGGVAPLAGAGLPLVAVAAILLLSSGCLLLTVAPPRAMACRR